MTPEEMAALQAAAMATRPWTAAEFEGLIATGAIALGDTYAFALYRIAADEAELLTIATHPDHRRQGRASSLLAEFHDAARNHGATRVFLEVASRNASARALYSAAGYAEIGRRPRYYSEGNAAPDDAIVMEKRL